MRRNERPQPETGGAVGGSRHDHSTSPAPPFQDPKAAAPVPVRDRLRWTWDDVEALTGMSKRWMQREISAGRMPPPDLRMGRCAGWRPATIMSYLDSVAQRGARGGRA
jgi:predicted DNA-binding transcriptional regulator AlpA